MLWTIAAALMTLWLLAIVTSTMIGGFVHVLIVVAFIVIIPNLFRGKKRRQLKLLAVPGNQRMYSRFTERESLRVL